jgi:hypothetical protein
MEKRNEPYNRFAFSGQEALKASIDDSDTFKNAYFFGELVVDRRGQKAVVQGLMVSPDRGVNLSLRYRNLPKGYQHPFGKAFTENTLPSTERGSTPASL